MCGDNLKEQPAPAYLGDRIVIRLLVAAAGHKIISACGTSCQCIIYKEGMYRLLTDSSNLVMN